MNNRPEAVIKQRSLTLHRTGDYETNFFSSVFVIKQKNVDMKNLIITFLTIMGFISCEIDNKDQKVTIVVIDKEDSLPIKGINIRLTKREDVGTIFSSYTTLDTYSGQTDSLGNCTILIEDFDDEEKYSYPAWINEDHHAYGAFFYSLDIVFIDRSDPTKKVNSYLSRIPVPDVTDYFK